MTGESFHICYNFHVLFFFALYRRAVMISLVINAKYCISKFLVSFNYFSLLLLLYTFLMLLIDSKTDFHSKNADVTTFCLHLATLVFLKVFSFFIDIHKNETT